MLWRIRTTLVDRPGSLAELAARCGADDINILGLEVFTSASGAVDELVVSAGATWSAGDLAALVAEAGCTGTTVRRCQADVLSDAPTRYLRGVLRLIDDPCAVDEELEKLQGFDEYTPAEWARADVLVEIAGRLAAAADDDPPAPGLGVPQLRRGTADDAAAVVAMHDRCSYETRAQRYHAPMPRLTARTARHLAAPAGGAAVVAGVGPAVVGMATVAPWKDLGSPTQTVMEVAVLVEDGWQRRGIGAALLRQVIAAARESGADRVVCVVQPGNFAMLRTVSAAGLRARIVSSGGLLTVSIALSDAGVAGGVAERAVDGATDRPAVPYGQGRGVNLDRRSATARPAGASADEYAFAGAGALPALPDRARAVDADGADRGGRP